MVSFRETSNLVDQAIRGRKDLWIRFRDVNASFTEEVISPFSWIDDDKMLFRAFSHLRGAERFYHVFTIVSAHISDDGPGFSPIEQEELEQGEQVRAAPLIARPISRSQPDEPGDQPGSPALPLLSRAETPADWRRLMQYFQDCLERGAVAVRTFPKDNLYLISIEREQVDAFLRGEVDLQFTLSYRSWQESFRKFLDPALHPGAALFLGSSFYFHPGGELSPLLMVPVQPEIPVDNQVIIHPGALSASAAPLFEAGLAREETAAFLLEVSQQAASLGATPSPGTSPLEAVEAFIRSRSSSLLARETQLVSSSTHPLENVPERAYYDGIGLFWMPSPKTPIHIDTLDELARESHWNSAPDALLAVLNSGLLPAAQSPASLAEAPFTLAGVSRRQDTAARLVLGQPVAVIEGPSGSGKTRLLIDLILQACLDGKTILFSSPAAQVVDSVAHRLIQELDFPGVVYARSDGWQNSARRLETLLEQAHEEDVRPFHERYQFARETFEHAVARFEQVKELSGREVSYRSEIERLAALLPPGLANIVLRTNLPYDENEKQRLQETIARLSDEVRELVNTRSALQAQTAQALTDPSGQHVAVKYLNEFSERWGPLGRGRLSYQNVTRLEGLSAILSLWKQVLQVLEARRDLDTAQTRLGEIRQKAERSGERLTDDQRAQAADTANRFPRSLLISQYRMLGEIKENLEKRFTANPNWTGKLTSRLLSGGQRRSSIQQLSEIIVQLGWPDLAASVSAAAIEDQLSLCEHIQGIVRTAVLLQKAQETGDHIRELSSAYEAKLAPLPSEIRADISKMNLVGFDAASLHQAIEEIRARAQAALVRRRETTNHIAQFLGNNSLRLNVIERLREAFTGPERAIFHVDEDIPEDLLEKYLHIWRRITRLWEDNSVLVNVRAQQSSLPPYDEMQRAVEESRQAMTAAARDLLRAAWLHRTANLDAAARQGARRYFQSAQAGEARVSPDFAYAQRIFPVWVASTEDVNQVFPLTSELFDMLVIDHASLENIPQGLPVLYRAINIVLAGDPRAVRYPPLIDPFLDRQLQARHRIDPSAFACSTQSLFDLAAAASKDRVIRLDDQHRTDPRIAAFIDQEFYDTTYPLLTDLTRPGVPGGWINNMGGAAWINRKGAFRLASGGSAFNMAEVELIRETVERLLARFDNDDVHRHAVAVIAPFREQAERLRAALQPLLGSTNQVSIGTPSDFIGKEADIVILSPVLAAGAPKEILDRPEMDCRQLNLAVSRARLLLLVVGDRSYCANQLPQSNCYNHLARYISETTASVVESLSDLSILGGSAVSQSAFIPDPSAPRSSRTTPEQVILSTRDYIYWIDPRFDQSVIPLFEEVFDRGGSLKVKEIRLLTTDGQVRAASGKPALRVESLLAFSEYLKNRGVHFELRVLPPGPALERSLLLHAKGTFQVPPFHQFAGKHVAASDLLPARFSPGDFQLLWGKALRPDIFRK